jgi:N-acyl-D-amino-acid deacylase
MNVPFDTIHAMAMDTAAEETPLMIANLSRRKFLQGVTALGGLVLAVGLPASVRGEGPPKYGADGMPHGWIDSPLVFVAIGEDGIVSIVCHRSEMGQGVRTGMPMIVADELEADWARVRVVQATGDEVRYGNQDTDGSRSTRHFFMPMRRCGAAARQMLESAAAARWKVPVSEVQAKNSEVIHVPTGRRLGYGALAKAAASMPLPAADTIRLKEPSQFRYIGTGKLKLLDAQDIATGKALAPGFIDAHTHDDRAVLCGPDCMLCKMSQGVATVVVGNCGISLSPVRMTSRPVPPLDLLGDQSWWTFDSFGEYADRLAREPPPVNTYALIGHMSLRVEAMSGNTQRAATDEEAARMQRRLADALAQGASGFSTGLYYPPNTMAPTDEVIAVAEALRGAGGIYVTHMRDEADHVLLSIEETLKIGRAVGVPVVISHHKCAMPENYGRSFETLPRIDTAAAAQRVDFDVYPYAAGSTVLMPERLRPDVPVQITWSVPHPELAGRMLDDIARCDPPFAREAAERLLPAGAIFFQMDEQDVQRILAHRLAMIGSDGLPHDAFPHPRLWGTFPRVLGHYARDLGLFSMEAAVHKMTGRTADVFGLVDRGVIRAGAYADLVLFDPVTVRDASTFAEPTRTAEGILETWINGQSAFVAGKGAVAAHAGRLVTRNR